MQNEKARHRGSGSTYFCSRPLALTHHLLEHVHHQLHLAVLLLHALNAHRQLVLLVVPRHLSDFGLQGVDGLHERAYFLRMELVQRLHPL